MAWGLGIRRGVGGFGGGDATGRCAALPPAALLDNLFDRRQPGALAVGVEAHIAPHTQIHPILILDRPNERVAPLLSALTVLVPRPITSHPTFRTLRIRHYRALSVLNYRQTYVRKPSGCQHAPMFYKRASAVTDAAALKPVHAARLHEARGHTANQRPQATPVITALA